MIWPQNLLSFYNEHKSWIELIKDFVYFLGVAGIIKYFLNWSFKNKIEQIEKDLKIREAIESPLNEYVLEKYKNGIRDIGIRLIHWKNYPWRLADDAFMHPLWVYSSDQYTAPSGWLDKTGINFQEALWFSDISIYKDSNGIFFFSKKDTLYKGFQEFKNICLIAQMPFANIINFDFKEFIEYESVFYTKYSYTDKRLYCGDYIVREKFNEPYFRMELSRGLQVKNSTCFKYRFLQFKFGCKNKILRLRTADAALRSG